MPGADLGPISLTRAVADQQTQLRRLRIPPAIHKYTKFGTVTAADGGAPLPNDSGVILNIMTVRAMVRVAPTSTPVIVDVTVDGTSIFTATQPQVPVGATLGTPVPPDAAPQWLPGQVLYVNVIQGDADATDLYVTIGVA